MNQPPGPPPGPPPGGNPQGRPSRLRPPWRDAAPERRAAIVVWAVAGFLLPWVVIGAGIVLIVAGHPAVGAALVLFALLIDLAGFVVMMAADKQVVRGAAYGVFTGCLTHLILAAVAVVVLFGICVSMLNGH